jgi:hypothetical protein
MSMLDYALHHATKRWPVFPCKPRGKSPAIARGFLQATTDPQQLRTWWRKHPMANIGLVPGRAGFVVIDIDGPAAETAAQQMGLLVEPTLTVITARGWHLYFRHSGGQIGNRKIGLLDVRADRGYVLLPPSVHPSGHTYQWADEAARVLPLPQAVLVELVRPPAPRVPPGAPVPVDAGTPRRNAYVVRAVELELDEVAHAREGARNSVLNRAAFSLARFVETGEAEAGRLVNALSVVARQCGLPEDEIDRTIRSAFKARGVKA